MSKVLEASSTLTSRYQTTIPEQVRKALHVNKGDKICYSIDDSGQVVLSRYNDEDPVLDGFLTFLANDIKSNPKNIAPLTSKLYKRVKKLVDEVEVDLDAPLSGKDE